MPTQPRLIAGLRARLRGMFAVLTGVLLRPDTQNREQPDMELQPSGGDQGDGENDGDTEETDRLGED